MVGKILILIASLNEKSSMTKIEHLTAEQLEEGLDHIRRSPGNRGTLDLIAIRPAEDQRKILEIGRLDKSQGLIGDNWSQRPSSRTTDKSPHPDMQINIMNARAAQLVAQSKDRWALAGDQLYVDLDLSGENLPPGTRLEIGEAVLEVTDQPHRGCKKFVSRFGLDAMKFVNSETGRELNLRGINARVIKSGEINTGDVVTKVEAGTITG